MPSEGVAHTCSITEYGVFSYLFNIYCTADDPLNPARLPDGFRPLPTLQPLDFEKCHEFRASSYIASMGIWKTMPHLSFEATTSEGAIVVMPDGAVSYKLKNVSLLRNYIYDNLEGWYRFANGPCGREIGNGDLRIVIGCDKAPSWGLAALHDMSQTNASSRKVEIKVVAGGNVQESSLGPASSNESQQSLYSWEHTGCTATRAGPDHEDIMSLRHDDPHPPRDGRYLNNTLFIRSINPALSPSAWTRLCEELKMPLDVGGEPSPSGHQLISSMETDKSAGSGFRSSAPSAELGKQASSGHEPASGNGSFVHVTVPVSNDILWGSDLALAVSSPTKIHPSKFINQMLMRKYPGAQVVMSEDQDWCSLPDGISLSDMQEMSEEEIVQLLERNGRWKLVQDHGCVFLEEVNENELSLDLPNSEAPLCPPSELDADLWKGLLRRLAKLYGTHFRTKRPHSAPPEKIPDPVTDVKYTTRNGNLLPRRSVERERLTRASHDSEEEIFGHWVLSGYTDVDSHTQKRNA